MKKNLKIIQINGFRGLLLTIFIISCLIAGFIVFPAFLSMNAWNYLAVRTDSFPIIDFSEGLLLWSIIAFSAFVFGKKKFIVSFNTKQELSEDEVNDVVSRFKAQNTEQGFFISKDFHLKNIDSNDIKANENENKIDAEVAVNSDQSKGE